MKPRLHVLFVCSMNKWRSPTAEYLYRNDPRLQARSAGTKAEARRRISESDIKWADVIFVMESEHKQWIVAQFKGMKLPRIEILDIPDDYQYMDPELQRELRALIDPEIDAMIAANK
ncbi:MAG TPA: protein tyrosine phosphatase [Opitutaceae bacterium]|nr:protein tyrosine phosphatase [Opitutaceae bacterium]